jgi:hypothetical protein
MASRKPKVDPSAQAAPVVPPTRARARKPTKRHRPRAQRKASAAPGLTPDIVERLIEGAEKKMAGMLGAAAHASVPYETVKDWLRDSLKSDANQKLRDFGKRFRMALTVARARMRESQALAGIGGDENARHRWLFAHDEEYHEAHSQQKLELSGKDGGPIAFEDTTQAHDSLLSKLSDLAEKEARNRGMNGGARTNGASAHSNGSKA